MVKYALFLLTLLSAWQADAQYRNSLQDYYLKKVIDSRRFIRRLAIGGGKHFIPATINMQYEGWDLENGKVLTKELTPSAKLKNAWCGYLGSFIPIALVSDNSMIVFNTELAFTSATFEYDSLLFQGTKRYMKPFHSYRVGALLSVEYRVGGDIPLNKNEGVMLTIGGGLNPCIVNTSDFDKILPYKVMPFIKGELGFFAGMAFKIRGIYYFGNSLYADESAVGISDNGVGDMLHTNITGGNGFDIALVLIPFSVNWNSDNW